MTSRLRYLLATSRAALTGALVVIATVVYALAERFPLWHGDWWWGYDNLIQALPVVVLVVAVVVGWQAGSRSCGVTALTDRGPDRMRKVGYALVAVPLGSAFGVLLIATSFVAVATWDRGGEIGGRTFIVLAAHASMVLLAAAVGLAAGSRIATPYSALVAAAGVGTLVFVDPPGTRDGGLFTLPGWGAGPPGEQPSLVYFGVVLVACLTAAAALTWAACQRRRADGRPLVAAVCVAVAALIAGSYLLPYPSFVVAEEYGSECLHDHVEVCVFPGYSRLLRPAAAQLSTVRSQAIAQGVPGDALPTSFWHMGNVLTPTGVGELLPRDETLLQGRLTPTDIAWSLSAPTWCPELSANTFPEGLIERRDLVFDWILWLQGEKSVAELIEWHPQLAGLTEAEFPAVVEAKLRELRLCMN